ncbi:MAG: hypothetical protein A3G24_03825 [Betaproteobacteria bacterium RIFCSPLOWO2_12_FULL_62_13]|nr:MAG: hypothetical protein A3G24_03825 [Betaproteobacteria bacterium RIFCSPLOWO2_12_FULL_62_13]
MTAFKFIPWADVIAAAPTVARGAKKLWTAVKDSGSDALAEGGTESGEGRLQALEAQVAELRKEIAASSELINSLAGQNARLVEAVGILRVRTRALLAASVIGFVLLTGLGAWILVA